VELQCSHSSIVRGFLSGATNRRTDEYGGSPANRARLLTEIVAAVRSEIGSDLALGVRLCGDELLRDGITIDQAVETARIVEATGKVDYINTSIGVATATLFMIEASMHIPPGYALFIPSAIRAAVALPVVGVGRFKDPLQGERALEEGVCDLVGVVRGQIADPDFAAKAKAGHVDDIRLCLSCNQECVGRMGLNRWLGCIENPATGRESVPPLPAPARRRRVTVVGAGPGGLQTAIAAARSGHDVEVFEARSEPGGQVRLAASVPNRAEFGDMIRNQLAECARLGVSVACDTPVDLAFIRARNPDHVVIATGAVPVRPWFALAGPEPSDTEEGGASLGIADVREVLDGTATPAGSVVVFDELGFHQATSVAELLADRGCEVEIVTPGMVVGQDLGVTLDMEGWRLRAGAKGIRMTTDTIVTGIDGRTLHLMHHPTGVADTRAADWFVLAVHQAPADSLYHECRAAGIPVERVGDALVPRRAHAAVLDGQRVGSTIGAGDRVGARR
jgi:2,4-dienoyl-CoA reductase (NADPH2)